MTPLVAAALLAAAPSVSPWNGTWTLDVARSSPVAKEGAADGYRFTVGADGALRWEIPSLREVADGRLDGRPFPVRRPTDTHGLTLSVRAEGPREWVYTVDDVHGLQGGGRMVLVDDGRAWVDLTWAVGHPEARYEIVYTRS